MTRNWAEHRAGVMGFATQKQQHCEKLIIGTQQVRASSQSRVHGADIILRFCTPSHGIIASLGVIFLRQNSAASHKYTLRSIFVFSDFFVKVLSLKSLRKIGRC